MEVLRSRRSKTTFSFSSVHHLTTRGPDSHRISTKPRTRRNSLVHPRPGRDPASAAPTAEISVSRGVRPKCLMNCGVLGDRIYRATSRPAACYNPRGVPLNSQSCRNFRRAPSIRGHFSPLAGASFAPSLSRGAAPSATCDSGMRFGSHHLSSLGCFPRFGRAAHVSG